MLPKTAKNETKTNTPPSWVSPQCSLSYNNFLEEIEKTENGQFHTIQQSMENFEQWLKLREKK